MRGQEKSKKIRPEKESVVREIGTRVASAKYVFLVDYTGMNSGRTIELRRRMRKCGARYQVVPNRLFKQATKGGVDHGVQLAGPTAMIVGEGDVVETAKTLLAFVKEAEKPVVKGGAVEGKLIGADQIKALASLPAKPVLQAMLLGTLQAPMRNLAGVLGQKLASLVYVLKAVQEKKEKVGAPAA